MAVFIFMVLMWLAAGAGLGAVIVSNIVTIIMTVFCNLYLTNVISIDNTYTCSNCSDCVGYYLLPHFYQPVVKVQRMGCQSFCVLCQIVWSHVSSSENILSMYYAVHFEVMLCISVHEIGP